MSVKKGADAGGKNKLNLDEELDLETLSLETAKNFERLAPLNGQSETSLFYIKDFQVESALHVVGQAMPISTENL